MPTIVLGVSGSIAAYKAADLASQLVKAGYAVFPVLTPGAARFVGPITFSALSGNPCPSGMFEEPFPGEIAHIHLARIADLFVIAPASMDVMAKLANGLADDMLTAATMATKAPVILAPGMNTAMWENPATQANLDRLSKYGYRFIEPISGRLACRTEGLGKMAEVETIFAAIRDLLEQSAAWAGRSVLVTAGPTREPIDPVRYLTNRSSGKMGYSIAEAAARLGAKVTLITGPTSIPAPNHPNIAVEAVVTAVEMERAAMAHFGGANVVFAAAAVSDYRPTVSNGNKIKKGEQDLTLTLTRNPDILAAMGRAKRTGQVLVGFAAETEDLERNALAKLESKNLDFVVANDVTHEGAGFDVDTNIALVLGSNGSRAELPLMSKRELAEKLLEMTRPMVG
jgi:phosphopantothenoylcysteine decarboxylase / phosphopantothenate---cysteine ligase